MRFIRSGRIRERIVDFLSKAILIAFSALVCLWMVSGARAAQATQINAIQSKAEDDGRYTIEFQLSAPIAKEDVTVEYLRNFVQVSLKSASAYPARTEKLNAGIIDKVFTYQYQPDLARARVLLKGPASAVQDRSSWEISDKSLRLSIRSGGAIAATAAAKTTTATKLSTDVVRNKSSSITAAELSTDPDDAQIVKEILAEAKGEIKPTPIDTTKLTNTENQPIFTQKPKELEAKRSEPNAAKVFASLLLVVGVIGAAALAYRRFTLGKGIIGSSRQNRMIEVIANQGLGPKRSIALIKVLDQYMVVGMSGESMNLLSNLGTNVNLDKFTDDTGIGATFADTFRGALTGGSESKESAPADLGIRAMIKKHIEGFKPL